MGGVVILSRPDERRNGVPASQPPNKRTWQLAGAVALLFVTVIGALAIAFPKQLAHQVEISVVRQPTPYTQLFFSDSAVLPKQLKVDRMNTFTFTVINDQGLSETYHYIVTMTSSKSREVVSQGSFTIINNASTRRSVAVKPKYRRSHYLITVALSGTADFIQFYGDTP